MLDRLSTTKAIGRGRSISLSNARDEEPNFRCECVGDHKVLASIVAQRRDHRHDRLHARWTREQPASDAAAVRDGVPRHRVELRVGLPRDFDVDEMRRDLASHDALHARVVRLQKLLEKAHDTDTALGSDVMVAALEGYAFLKAAGKAEGVDALRKLLGRRFDGNGRKAETVVRPVAEPA